MGNVNQSRTINDLTVLYEPITHIDLIGMDDTLPPHVVVEQYIIALCNSNVAGLKKLFELLRVAGYNPLQQATTVDARIAVSAYEALRKAIIAADSLIDPFQPAEFGKPDKVAVLERIVTHLADNNPSIRKSA